MENKELYLVTNDWKIKGFEFLLLNFEFPLRIPLFHMNKKNTPKLDRQPGKHRIIDLMHNQCKYHKYISYHRIGGIMGSDFGLNAPAYSKIKISYTLSKISYTKMLPPFIGQYAASQGAYTKQ